VTKQSWLFLLVTPITVISLLNTLSYALEIDDKQTLTTPVKENISFLDATTLLKRYYNDPDIHLQKTSEMFDNLNNESNIIKLLNTRGHLQAKIGFCKFVIQLKNINISPALQRVIETLSHHKDKHVANQALITLLAIKNNSVLYWQKRFLEAKTKAFNKMTLPEEKFKTISVALDSPDLIMQNWALHSTYEWSGISSVQTGDLALPIATMVANFIDSNDPTNRLIAATILEQLTETAHKFAPEILAQLKIESVSTIQIKQLKLLGTLAYLPALNVSDQLLNSKNLQIKTQSALTIGRICEQADNGKTTIDIEPIVIHLSQCYQDANGTGDLRKALINAMRKITITKTYNALKGDHFRILLIDALDDISPQVRREAATTISLKYETAALPIFLNREMSLLNDPDTSVRFAIMDTIEKYGSDMYLDIILQRLQIEDHDDARDKLTNTFCNIAEPLTIEKTHTWAKNIKTTMNHDKQTVLIPLFKRILTIINNKMTQNKLQEIKTLPTIEYHTLISQFEYAPTDKRKDELANSIVGFAADHLNTKIVLDKPINIILNDLKQITPILTRWLIVKEKFTPKQTSSITTLVTQLQMYTKLISPIKDHLSESEIKYTETLKSMLSHMIIKQTIATDPIDLTNIDQNLEQLIKLNEKFSQYPKAAKVELQIEFLKQLLIDTPLPTPKTAPQPATELPTIQSPTE